MTMKLVLPLLIAAPLAACVSFGEKPPESLMTLSSTAELPAGTARTVAEGSAVAIAVPIVPQELAAARVPVTTGTNALAYLKDAVWSDAPARLFRNLVAETIAAQTGRTVLEPRQFALSPGARLGGRLSSFGLDASANQVTVRYDATLIRRPDTPLETRRFEAQAPVTVHEAGPVAAAMNVAANQVAGEVAAWVGR